MNQQIDKKLALTYDKIFKRIQKIRIVTSLNPMGLNQVDVELNGILLDLKKLMEE